MFNVAFELTGTTAMLMHADDVEASDTLSAWRKDEKNRGLSVAGDDRSPAWTWQSYLYSDGENIAIPSANLMVCLRQAGARKILKKQTTYKEITQSGMSVGSEFMEFRVKGNTVPLAKVEALKGMTFSEQAAACQKLGFRLFVKRAPIQRSKHVRVRPRFDSWSVRGQMEVVAKELTMEVLQEVFDIAGRVGLGDWRPGCKTPGAFGMFTAKLKRV